MPLEAAGAAVAELVAAPDLLVVGCDRLGLEQVQQVEALATALSAQRTLVVYASANEHSLKKMQQLGLRSAVFPPEPAFLAFELGRLPAELAAREGSAHLGDIVTGKPRQISAEELAQAGATLAGKDDICPARLAALVIGLVGIEQEIAAGAVGNWSDAAVRACAYTYAGQARWLMEKALQVVLSRQDESSGERREAGITRLHSAA